MNKEKLRKEGKNWVKDGIITDQQLEAILNKYVKKDQSYLLILFSVLLIGIGVLIFIFSDWAQVPHFSRLSIMIFCMLTFYIVGHYFAKRSTTQEEDSQRRSHIYGMSFIILGYIFFGATLFLILNVYQVHYLNVWPFIIWSIVGLLLYSIYENPTLFVLALLITIFTQIYSAFAFSTYSSIAFLIFSLGYFYFVFHRSNPVFNYIFAIGLSIQLVIHTVIEAPEYYWMIFFFLLMYTLAHIIPKPHLRQSLIYISLLSIFIFKIYESFLLQESYFLEDMHIQVSFFVIISICLFGAFVYKRRTNPSELIDLLLFLPLFYLPFSFLFVILSMFVFSVYWLVVGFQRKLEDKIIIGIMSFIISTFTAYIQFAWETLNKSLFFLLGGILLFLISFILERKRRTTEIEKGGHTK
ncbi:DUF2157 domain-containing protein [Pseudogracilibacillus sp. SE30717A]|uniref:DUF2157 domain-containing protein n=1 Tax=Pseudogracilibacillus sp. SE30717A TaxID=3098293 RepID=UPI00300DEBD3